MIRKQNALRRISLLLLVVVAAFSFAAFAAACSGSGDDDDDRRTERRSTRDRDRDDDDDKKEATATPRPRRTPTPDAEKDTDDDGVADIDDACPKEADRGQWTDPANPDGCPDTLEDLLVFARDDVDGFWQVIFDDEGVDYTPPFDFLGYDDTGDSACGELVPNNAFYCPLDHSIYLHLPFLQGMLDDEGKGLGDFAVAFVVAHEWGHLVQGNLGIFDQDLYSIEIELQADCFAGAWAYDAEQRELLEDGDIQEGLAVLYSVRDPRDTPFLEPGAHGTAGQRIDAFNTGYEVGLGACFNDLTIPSNINIPDGSLDDQ